MKVKTRLLIMRVSIILGVLLVIFSQDIYAQSKKFKVTGEVTGIKEGKIRVSYAGPGAKDFYRDSLYIVDGKFVYQGKMEEPHLVSISFDLPLEERMKKKSGFNLFLDGTTMKVRVDRENLAEPIVTGSPAHRSYEEIQKNTNLFRRMGQVSIKSSNAWKERNQEAIDASNSEREGVMDSLANYLFSLKGASESTVVAFFVNSNLKSMNHDKLENVLNKFSPEFQTSLYVKEIMEDVDREKNVKVGVQTPLFSLSDTTGRVWTNADYKGKYLLIDFGASWCGWCKLEKPFLLDVYEKFKGDKFELINISLDKDKLSWVTDLERENYPWISISDLKGFEGNITKDFNISGVPEIMLIDPQGKIIAKGLRGEKIAKTIGIYL